MLVALAGDLHGALEEAYRRLDTWEAASGERYSMLLQVGDLGAVEDASPLDRATLRHAQRDPSQLGVADYLEGRRTAPRPTWFVRGNHEDFDLLARRDGAALDPAGLLRCLRDGAIHDLEGLRVAALGGIQPRTVKNPRLPRYVQPEELQPLLEASPESADLLLAHDGPIGHCLRRMRSAGSVGVYDVIKRLRPRLCFFGHYDDPPGPFVLHGCRCLCLNLPGPGRLATREGGVAVLRTPDWSLAWVDPAGREHPVEWGS